MRRLLLILIFVIVFAITMVVMTPLGFVLSRTGVQNFGVGWAKVDGNLFKGRISGFYVGSQPVGDVLVTLKPLSLLSLQPSYDVQWGGAGGRGTGIITLSGNSISADEVRFQQDLSTVEALAIQVRAIGGNVRLSDGAVRVSRQGCETASGTLSSDALQRLADQYGKQFGAISGPIRCENGAFKLDLAGQSEAGDRVDIDAQADLLGHSKVDVVVDTVDPQIGLALIQIGFQNEDGRWTYSRATGE